jgi:hypothetical protein
MKKELNKTKSVFVKKSKMSLAKSTTALTCLIGTLIISSDLGLATSPTTTTGAFTASGSVASSCTLSAATLAFDDWVNVEQNKTVPIIANCTNGTTYNISIATLPDASPVYYLVRAGGVSTTASDRLEVTFKNTDGVAMTNGAATISSTGTGAAATAGTITGTMATSQTGKTAGSYSKIMTLNIVY